MKTTNSEAVKLLETSSIGDVARELHAKFGDEAGSASSIKARLHRLRSAKPKKGSAQYAAWASTAFLEILEFNSSEVLGRGRPKLRLSDQPKKRTIDQIMQPKIEELLQFADEQGVTVEEVLELVTQRCHNKSKCKGRTEIPVDESVAFYFNNNHSSRSWTELRLFLLKFGIQLPTRNDIDLQKKSLHPTIHVEEIKSFVHYKDLVDNTVRGL